MKLFNRSAEELIDTRTSWRKFTKEPVTQAQFEELQNFIDSLSSSPFGNICRFGIVSGSTEKPSDFKNHGTYGFIKNPSVYIAVCCNKDIESIIDTGYLTELVVLKLTDLGLGSCWLGGSFTKSSFNRAMNCSGNEILPFVIAAGNMGNRRGTVDKIVRLSAGARKRISFRKLFFNKDFETPLNKSGAGDFAIPLEMVRAAPSASNRQPWRVLKDGNSFHFFINRIKSYNKTLKIMKLADLPASDIGIAMSHFETTLAEKGITGKWERTPPQIDTPAEYQYASTWISE